MVEVLFDERGVTLRLGIAGEWTRTFSKLEDAALAAATYLTSKTPVSEWEKPTQRGAWRDYSFAAEEEGLARWHCAGEFLRVAGSDSPPSRSLTDTDASWDIIVRFYSFLRQEIWNADAQDGYPDISDLCDEHDAALAEDYDGACHECCEVRVETGDRSAMCEPCADAAEVTERLRYRIWAKCPELGHIHDRSRGVSRGDVAYQSLGLSDIILAYA